MAAEPPTRHALRERYDLKQQVVIDHAATEFALRGFHATSMHDLTLATGLTPGGLYHYIGSKDNLLVMICDRLMEPLLAEAREIAAADWPADEQLRQIVRVWMATVAQDTDHMRVFLQERHVLEDGSQWRKVRRQRKEFEELLATVLARGEHQGRLHFADPELALKALLGMVNHTAQWFRPRGRLTAQEIADGYVDLLLS
ncbi:MAG TPA: TetR/AcrR family transcriptional regulator [Solirubrobacteraceae bacterium]|jgi:AcrR family transcriptional regulator|nr:TetR/AcrR family transcriptional regulator [Solirubrobacteraceae bacterium]